MGREDFAPSLQIYNGGGSLLFNDEMVLAITSMVHKNLMVPSLFLTLFPFIPLTGPNFQ
jgi:hypothetical protein